MENALFETDRLGVRHLVLEDAAPYIQMHGDAEVMNPIPAPLMSQQQALADLKLHINKTGKANVKVKIYAVVEKKSGEFIGTCALVDRDDNQVEIGYRLLKAYWGQGFGAELAQGLIAFAFEHSDYSSVLGIADAENLASKRILEQLMTLQKEAVDPDSGRLEFHYTLENLEKI
jgi:ribosomal-protein-alanine N-acetyltransferase